MLKYFILGLIISLAVGQTIHCSLASTPIAITSLAQTGTTVTAVTTNLVNPNYTSVATGIVTWTKPAKAATATITVGNDKVTPNGSLYYVAAIVSDSTITISSSQTGVIKGDQNCTHLSYPFSQLLLLRLERLDRNLL